MDAYSVYRDIQKRTKGQFLIGVVGPVRDGKVHPDPPFPGGAGTAVSFGKGTGGGTGCPAFKREGKTITTVEPKFVPKDAVELQLGGGRSDPAATGSTASVFWCRTRREIWKMRRSGW